MCVCLVLGGGDTAERRNRSHSRDGIEVKTCWREEARQSKGLSRVFSNTTVQKL